ncbi:MAG: hypothetical protein H6736_07250 [Alphaproteobacteria bacterium]|nr:hypothetical protein [Alphaproteobacteria bacterium]
MVWLFVVLDASASGRFAVPPVDVVSTAPDAGTADVRYRARPTLLNPSSDTGRVWSVGALVTHGRFPAQECEKRRVSPELAYLTCREVWRTEPEVLEVPAPWWAFWR